MGWSSLTSGGVETIGGDVFLAETALRALLDPREVVLAVAVVAPKVPPVSLPLLLIAFHRVALPLTRATKPAHAALASAFALAAVRRHLSNLRGAILPVTVGVHARHRPSRCQVVSTVR